MYTSPKLKCFFLYVTVKKKQALFYNSGPLLLDYVAKSAVNLNKTVERC